MRDLAPFDTETFDQDKIHAYKSFAWSENAGWATAIAQLFDFDRCSVANKTLLGEVSRKEGIFLTSEL
jgi:hypothetical protein